MRLLTLSLLLSLPAFAQIEGRWYTEDKSGIIEVSQRDGKFFGKIVGGKKRGDGLDRKNPDPAEREKPTLGKEILKNLEADGEGEFSGGSIYDPDSGNTYQAKAELKGNTLRIRGFVGVSLFGRTTEWTRVPQAQNP